MNQAMELAVIFSERNECTRKNPVKVEVGEGEHVIIGGKFLAISCDHITIAGKGKGKTTCLGGFGVNGKQNVKIQQLSASNIAGHGLSCANGATVDVTECCFKSCRGDGMFVYGGATVTATRCDFMKNGECGMAVGSGATVTATRCDFMENGHYGVDCVCANTKVRLNDSTMHHNGVDGLHAFDHAVMDLHGTKTDIHSNKECGIVAIKNAKVNIHLPSQHNTSHDNVRNRDRLQMNGGSIANINADGTFTHVGEV